MITDLLKFWTAPIIRIEVDPELFVFRSGGKVFSTEPCLHIFEDEILAIGIQYDGAKPAEVVHLFRPPMHPLGGTRPLESLLRHGIMMVSRRGWLFQRPKLHFVVSANMGRFTSGFHSSIFMSAGFNSIVRWDPDWVTVTTEA